MFRPRTSVEAASKNAPQNPKLFKFISKSDRVNFFGAKDSDKRPYGPQSVEDIDIFPDFRFLAGGLTRAGKAADPPGVIRYRANTINEIECPGSEFTTGGTR